MATIVTRASKGSPLTHNEVDANFSNLNSDKVEASAIGTAAYTDSTDYATAAQGALADSAVQSGDNISELVNDAGYITTSYSDADVDSHLNTGTASSGEVLSWTGTDYDWIAAGGGGGAALQLYAENPSSPTAPSATGTNAVAIGDQSVSVGTRSIALGDSYASGTDSFAAAIANNTSSYGATGANSVAIGKQAKATASGAMAFGDRNTASAEDAVVFGENNTGSGSWSFTAGRSNANSGSRGVALGNSHTVSSFYTAAIGSSNTASQDYAIATGSNSLANRQGKFAHASLGFGTDGDSQSGLMVLSKATTDATPTVLTALAGGVPSSANMPVIPSGGAQAFSGLLVAKQTGSANAAAWEIKGLIVNNGGTTTLVNSAITVIDNTPSWGGPTVTADDTNDWLAITCTGAAATSIRWSLTLNTSEVIYT